ncbi:hypothetical protein BamMEX5DRAFT_5192 [Burkholderia ambifaria MEX-5]|uniref:Uncharacterized protein n=1 Tax=Burkholderia ambifaria MEX-5 TaxID=396597 RepID=B1TBM6_9BURK|nr:hypothetical protein BamMEX5DRAFT_5192 [Burkholderia ambifaria MEX-5]
MHDAAPPAGFNWGYDVVQPARELVNPCYFWPPGGIEA